MGGCFLWGSGGTRRPRRSFFKVVKSVRLVMDRTNKKSYLTGTLQSNYEVG
jgi:hypothetical protein